MVMISFGEGVAGGTRTTEAEELVHDDTRLGTSNGFLFTMVAQNKNQFITSRQSTVQGVVTNDFTIIHPVSIKKSWREKMQCRRSRGFIKRSKAFSWTV